MQVVDIEETRKIWDFIYSEYNFYPSVKGKKQWLKPHGEFRIYALPKKRAEQKKALINRILCEVVAEEMFALDWQHDCFSFDPNEKIPTGNMYYDSERNVNAYFPGYYPDGDYHFFVSKDWRFGLYGHPWRKELIVVGEELISEIEKHLSYLCLKKKSRTLGAIK